MFTVKETKSYEPKSNLAGVWKVCSPETVPDFSAVGYLFGRDLNQTLKLPVGIILSAYGASTAEAWVPRETIAADPQLKPALDRFDARETAFKEHPDAPSQAPFARRRFDFTECSRRACRSTRKTRTIARPGAGPASADGTL